MASHIVEHPNAALVESATKGFDLLFANDIVGARELFNNKDDPLHLMGLGVCAFLEAVLGMETNMVTEASKCLALSETASRKWVKTAASASKAKDQPNTRFPAGMEWEILNADAVVLLGLTNALSESYMGYLQCMYSLNNAHSKFTKLYKTVFPNGLPEPDPTPASVPTPTITIEDTSLSPPPTGIKHKSSAASISSAFSAVSTSTPPATSPGTPTGTLTPTKGLFSRWMSAAAASEPSLPLHGHGHIHAQTGYADGPVEELIISGTAFGYGLFNLVFSLLPKKVQGLVGFLGFQHDRKLALKALALSASKNDVHAIFSGLVLMTYQGVVLLLSGWQADEERLLHQYRGVIDKVEAKYPQGALWILNRAKILRMAYDPEAAIAVLKDGLKPGRTHTFAQADMMLWFEVAWTLLGQREYAEAADAFIKMTELNTWSHGTYYFIAAGCHFSIGNKDKAQELLDAIPGLIDLKKMGGKDLPTEVFIKKKLAFYKEKQVGRGGDPKRYIEAVKISPAEEIAIFWNTHARIDETIARAHIAEYAVLTPYLEITSPEIEDMVPHALSPSLRPASKSSPPQSASTTNAAYDDLDNADEKAVRALLLGICHKTVHSYDAARQFLEDALGYQKTGRVRVNTWVAGLATFEMGVSQLKEVEWREKRAGTNEREEGYWRKEWDAALKDASAKMDKVVEFSGSAIDLSSRLDSRVSMLRDEIAAKREVLGLSPM